MEKKRNENESELPPNKLSGSSLQDPHLQKMRTVLVNKRILTKRQLEMLENGKIIRVRLIGKVIKDKNQTDVKEGFIRVIINPKQ